MFKMKCLRIAVALACVTLFMPAHAADESLDCGFRAGMLLGTLLGLNDLTVTDQRQMTSAVPLTDAKEADLIFFKDGRKWGCPDGVSGVITAVMPGKLKFGVSVVPGEQELRLPSAAEPKGNDWYQRKPEVRSITNRKK